MADKEKKVVIGRVRLEGVRLSFAELFSPSTYEREDGTTSDPRFKANFLIPKDGGDLKGTYKKKSMPILQALKAAKLDAIARKYDGDLEKAKKVKIKAQNNCIKDGDEETWDGYADHYYVSASRKTKPTTKARDKRDVTEADGVLYSGCYVHAIVTLWHQVAGKKDGQPVSNGVFAALEAVQFYKKGDAFGAAGVDDDDFMDMSDDDDMVGDDDDDDDEDSLI